MLIDIKHLSLYKIEQQSNPLEELLDEGSNAYEIAEKLAIDVTTVRRKIHRHKLQLK